MNVRVKELRAALSLTSEAFGARLGVTKAAISKIENGSRSVTDQMVLSICREFNVNEVWLRTGQGEMFQQNSQSIIDRMADEYSLSQRERAVIYAFLELSANDRAAVMRYVDNLVDKLVPSSSTVDDATAAGIAAMQDYARMVAEEKEAEENSSISAG